MPYLSLAPPTFASELTVPHDLSVEVTLFSGIVLLLDTIEMLVDISRLAVDLGVDGVGNISHG